jgi:hypothetical protein
MVTTLPLTVHTLPVVDLMVGMIPEFCVAATLKVDKYTALVGAPVNVTVGAILVTARTAVTVFMTCGAGA